MQASNSHRRRWASFLGVIFWLGVLAFAALGVHLGRHSPEARAIPATLTDYMAQWDNRFRLHTGELFVAANDPIFARDGEGGWRQVGYVVDGGSGAGSASVGWFGDDPPRRYRFWYHYKSGSLEEAMATLLPAEKQAMLGTEIAEAMERHGAALSEAFVPVVRRLLQESIPVIADRLAREIKRRDEAFAKIGRRYESEILKKRLMPLIRSEVYPVVREHGEPVAKEIGFELWQRASLWRFGWRMAYDKLPLTEQDLTEKEWARFVQEEAVPIFEAHSDAVVRALQEIVADLARDPEVRRELGGVFRRLLKDDALKGLVGELMNEAVIDNARLHRAWQVAWSAPETQAALEEAMNRMEPVLHGISEKILGSWEEGITPEFARVIRHQILRKDHRWIVAERREGSGVSGSSITLQPARNPEPYPLVHLVGESELRRESVSR